jgi:hypothetical protein
VRRPVITVQPGRRPLGAFDCDNRGIIRAWPRDALLQKPDAAPVERRDWDIDPMGIWTRSIGDIGGISGIKTRRGIFGSGHSFTKTTEGSDASSVQASGHNRDDLVSKSVGNRRGQNSRRVRRFFNSLLRLDIGLHSRRPN